MKKLLVLVLAIAQSVTLFAQSGRYNDVAAFELKGKVKSCAVFYVSPSDFSNANSLSNPNDEYSFASNGKYIPTNNKKVEYDSNRYISTISTGNDSYIVYKYKNGKLSKKESVQEKNGYAFFDCSEYTYDARNRIVKETQSLSIDMMFDDKVDVFSYSDYKVDSRGNWTSRIKKDKDGKIIRKEVRKILYY